MCVGKRKFERKEEEEEDASNKGGTCFAFFSPDAEAGCCVFGKVWHVRPKFLFLKNLMILHGMKITFHSLSVCDCLLQGGFFGKLNSFVVFTLAPKGSISN